MKMKWWKAKQRKRNLIPNFLKKRKKQNGDIIRIILKVISCCESAHSQFALKATNAGRRLINTLDKKRENLEIGEKKEQKSKSKKLFIYSINSILWLLVHRNVFVNFLFSSELFKEVYHNFLFWCWILLRFWMGAFVVVLGYGM